MNERIHGLMNPLRFHFISLRIIVIEKHLHWIVCLSACFGISDIAHDNDWNGTHFLVSLASPSAALSPTATSYYWRKNTNKDATVSISIDSIGYDTIRFHWIGVTKKKDPLEMSRLSFQFQFQFHSIPSLRHTSSSS